MSENKKITYDDCKKALDEVYMPVAEINWNGLNLIVKKNLTFAETLNFVKYVVGLCFADGTNEYIPEARDFAIRVYTIENYTNVELPDDIEARNELLYHTDLMHTVLSNIEPQQFNGIIQAIDTKLDYLSNANVELINNKLEKLLDSFEDLYKSIVGVYDGVTQESLVGVVDAIKDGRLDENELVKAYFKQKKNEESK